MQLSVLLYNNYFLALAFLFGLTVDETDSCDTKWIRLVYMMSCGKRKRESVWPTNETYEDLPPDFDGAFKYFKKRDPFNPMFKDALLYKILEEDDKKLRVNRVPKLAAHDEDQEDKTSESTTVKTSSILLQKLFPKTINNKPLGIQGFPEQWDIEEIMDEKINENHRREIDRLIDECCKVPPVTTCNANTFSGACK